jgi:hypothetical protein
MIERGPASEDEVVVAFLWAEVDSPKWGPHYAPMLVAHHLGRHGLVAAADLSEPTANVARKALLSAVRGYGRGESLFQGFPADTSWRRVSIEPSDLSRLKCINHDAQWLRLTGGTRLVRDAARNLDSDPDVATRVRDTVHKIGQRAPMADLVVVEAEDGALIIVEGHTRATAYAVLSDRSFAAFVGTSPLMSQWVFI